MSAPEEGLPTPDRVYAINDGERMVLLVSAADGAVIYVAGVPLVRLVQTLRRQLEACGQEIARQREDLAALDARVHAGEAEPQ